MMRRMNQKADFFWVGELKLLPSVKFINYLMR